MKICLATADFPPIEGGLSRLSTDLAATLHQSGHLSGVLAPRLGESDSFDATVPYPITRFPGYNFGISRIIPGYLGSHRFRNEVLAKSEHMLAINPSFGGAYGLLARKMGNRTPFSVFAYGYEFLKFAGSKSRLGRKTLLRIYNDSEAVFAISRFTRDELANLGVPMEKIHLCYLGTDCERFQPERTPGLAREKLEVEPSVGPIILSVGRLIPRKKFDLVIRALSHLKDDWPNIQYWIVGQGPAGKEWKNIAEKLGVSPNVRFWGKVPDEKLTTFYQACDTFILPAVREGASVEGLGLVLQEAAACGKPTIGARSGGIPEAMVPGKTGLLVEPGDLPELESALREMLGDEGRRTSMGEVGRDWVRKERGWKGCVEHLLSVLGQAS